MIITPTLTMYKMRKVVSRDEDPRRESVFGITLPIEIGSKFHNCYFQFSIDGPVIIMQSGAAPQ